MLSKVNNLSKLWGSLYKSGLFFVNAERSAVYMFGSMVLSLFAGIPATTVLAGTFFVTTEPAPTTALSPIVIPGTTVAPAPIQTFRPITIGAG